MINCSFLHLYSLLQTFPTICRSVQPKCFHQKSTDLNFLSRYIYFSGSSGAIETYVATVCFYEFVSSLTVPFFQRCSSVWLFVFQSLILFFFFLHLRLFQFPNANFCRSWHISSLEEYVSMFLISKKIDLGWLSF